MIIGSVEEFHKANAVKKLLSSWWAEVKIFQTKNDGIYTMTNLRIVNVYKHGRPQLNTFLLCYWVGHFHLV